MTSLYCLSIHPSQSLEHAWNLIEEAGIEILYGSEEEGKVFIYVDLLSEDILPTFEWMISCDPYTLPAIDWKTQWANHSQNFHDGYLHVDLSHFGHSKSNLKLAPGPGFGDLSHPTTRLVLTLLAHYLDRHVVVDIGCGSGIITLAAAVTGASEVYGIDIDLSALEHSRQNAHLNHLHFKCTFDTPSEFIWKKISTPIITVMNMIQSEQEVAWMSLASLHHQPGLYLTSGIRVEEREEYLLKTSKWRWILQEEREEEGWLAFCFLKK